MTKQDDDRIRGGLKRRSFLQFGAIAPFGATALLAAGAQAQTPTAATAVADIPMVLRVNGHGHNDYKAELARRMLVRARIHVWDMPVAGAN